MKPPATAVALLGLGSAAVDLPTLQRTLPACSLQCLADGVAAHGCGLAQFPCQCARLEPIIRTVAPCLVKSGCGLDEMTDAARVVFKLCQEVAPDRVGTSAASATSSAASLDAEAHVPALGVAAVVAVAFLVR